MAPRDGSGTYSKPPGTTAIPNTTIASAPYNALQDDMADALTKSLPRTGVAPMLADLPMNGNKITGLADGADPGDAVNFRKLDEGLDAKLNADASNVGDATAQAAFFAAVTGTEWAEGDIGYINDEGRLVRLAKGEAGQVLTQNDGETAPEWGAGPVLTKEYVSAEQTITLGGSLTLAHGLGEKPKHTQFALRCLTAEFGYSVGDEIQAVGAQFDQTRGLELVANATEIAVLYRGSAGVVFTVRDKGSNTNRNLTLANWRLIVRAYA